MNPTNIEWTDFTSNPIKFRDANGKSVWACAKVSDGCKNCYAESLAKRYGRGGPFSLCPDEIRQILTSKKIAGKRVFVGDMTDIFGAWVTDEMLDTLFEAMAFRRDVTFQLLTKRPERMAKYLNNEDLNAARIGVAARAILGTRNIWEDLTTEDVVDRWSENATLPNVWLGTSVENQAAADERIPHLLKCPAAVRFLSCEPLLGPVNLRHLGSNCAGRNALTGLIDAGPATLMRDPMPALDWVIVGGESGPGSRPCNVEWIRGIVRQCDAAEVAVFVKQMGGVVIRREGRGSTIAERGRDDMAADREWPEGTFFGNRTGIEEFNGRQVFLKDKKGGDMSEWPEDLRRREFPKVGAL